MPYVADPSGVLPEARAFWVRSPGRGQILPVAPPEPGSGDVVVRTLRSGVSRGTRRSSSGGGVPPSQHVAMRSREVEKFCPRPRACETRPGQAGVVRSGGGNRGRPARRNSDRTTRHPHQHHRERRQQARRAPTPSLARSKYPVRVRESLIGEPSGNARRLTSSAVEYVGSRNVVTTPPSRRLGRRASRVDQGLRDPDCHARCPRAARRSGAVRSHSGRRRGGGLRRG
jgi:hypothetical protein